MPRNVQLPDGRILTIPDDATPDQLAALKNKLSSQFADLKTGSGMWDVAAKQAKSLFSQDMKPDYTAMAVSSPKYGLESGLESPAVDPQNASAMRTGAAVGSAIGGGIAAPVVTARALLGGATGSYLGGHAGKYIGGDTGETIGKTVGGLAGGVAGAGGWNPKPGASLFDLISGSGGAAEAPAVTPMTQSPYAAEYSATKAAQRAALVRSAKAEAGIPTAGTPQMEAGFTPAPIKVPIRNAPDYQLNAPQVSGPDSGNGRTNILTPLAKRGDPRAADELLRRGRSVLFVPAEEYPPAREVTSFPDDGSATSIVDLLRSLRSQE